MTLGVQRCIRIATDAIKVAERERIPPKEIAIGFALALQRLPLAALASAKPAEAAKVSAHVDTAMRVVRGLGALVREMKR